MKKQDSYDEMLALLRELLLVEEYNMKTYRNKAARARARERAEEISGVIVRAAKAE